MAGQHSLRVRDPPKAQSAATPAVIKFGCQRNLTISPLPRVHSLKLHALASRLHNSNVDYRPRDWFPGRDMKRNLNCLHGLCVEDPSDIEVGR